MAAKPPIHRPASASSLPAILCGLLFALAAPTVGTARAAGAPDPARESADPIDPGAIAGYFDRTVPEQMARYHAPGAACLVVDDHHVIFSRGYGLANLAIGTPMHVQSTVLSVGSLTKLFTATAIMQLAQRGAVDLDAPAERYVPMLAGRRGWDRRITVANLLTHTAGLDVHFIGIATADPRDICSPSQWLQRHAPVCILPPGHFINYSNDDYTVAGAIIEQLTGQRYEDYVRQNLLRPLAMDHSGFDAATTDGDSPVSAPAGPPACGYDYQNGLYRAVPPFFTRTRAYGGLYSTAGDLGHFMIAQLNEGQFGDSRILDQWAARQMQCLHAAPLASDTGWCYGFAGRVRNGYRIIEHGGAWATTTCKLALLPEIHRGVFVAYNTFNTALIDGAVDGWIDSLVPGPATAIRATPMAADTETEHGVPDAAGARVALTMYPLAPGSSPQTVAKLPAQHTDARAADGSDFAPNCWVGQYEPESCSQITFERVQILTACLNVTSRDGALRLRGLCPASLTLRRVGDDRFVADAPTGPMQIGFRYDPETRGTYMMTDARTYRRLAWYESPALHMGLFLAFVAVFALAILAHIVRLCVRSHLRVRQSCDEPRPSDFWMMAAEMALLVACALQLLFAVCFRLGLHLIRHEQFLYGVPAGMTGLLSCPLIAAACSGAAALCLVRAWQLRQARLWRGLANGLVVACLLLYLPLLSYWRLFGFCY